MNMVAIEGEAGHARGPGIGLVISCEHGGNRIPAPYRSFFTDQQAVLATHRGYDAGALQMAKALAAAFGAPLVASTVSRLLVDLNRSVGHPRLHFEAVRRAPAALRQGILKRYYAPHRDTVERLVRQAIAENGRVLHLASHSFTPELDGAVRRADIGLLYDPVRPGEAQLCARWKASLARAAPALVVRRNYPYAGKDDGLTRHLRRLLPPEAYIAVELEINQKHVAGNARAWAALRGVLVATLREALADFRIGNPTWPANPDLPPSSGVALGPHRRQPGAPA